MNSVKGTENKSVRAILSGEASEGCTVALDAEDDALKASILPPAEII